MKKNHILILFLFASILGYTQKTIIVGPQNDCNTKGIHKNIHTSSALLELGNSNSLKITTNQHRTLDASRIYNESGQLIWEWKGESRSETWYTKEHYLTVNSSKIKIEFYQGYSDPFCNGFIKVEVLNQKGDVSNVSSTVQKNQSISQTQIETNPEFSIQTSKSELVITYQEFSKALDLFYFAFKSKMTISSPTFDPMKTLLCRGLKKFNALDTKDQIKVDLMIGKTIGGPSANDRDSDWRLTNNYRSELERFYLEFNKIFNDFSNEVNAQLSDDCKTCKKLIEEYYNCFKNKTYMPESEFTALKIKVERCKNQQFEDLNGKTKKYLAILTNEKEGGPSAYNDEYKYRFTNSAHRESIKIIDKRVLNSKDILVKTANGLGVTDPQGFLFIRDQFDSIAPIYFQGDFFYFVKKNDNVKIVNWDGSLLKDIEFDRIVSDENNAFLYARKNGVWYLINEKTFNAQPTNFESVFIKHDLFIVSKNGKLGVLNRSGSLNGDISFDEIKEVPFNKSILIIKSNNLWAITQRSKIKSRPIAPDQFIYASTEILNTEKLILVRANNQLGFFDESGKILFDAKYLDYKFDENNRILMQSKSGWGVYDLIYGTPLSEGSFQSIERFSNKDYYKVSTKDKLGLIEMGGGTILQPLYDKLYNIQVDSEFNDTFLVVSCGSKYGSVSIDKIDLDKIHQVPVQFSSIREVENEWQKNKNNLYNKRLEEQNRIRQEEERIRRELEIAKINEEKNKIQRIRNSNPWGVAIRDYYGGGTVLEIFSDGSGIKIISGQYSGPIKEARQFCAEAFDKKMYLADLSDLTKAFNNEILFPNDEGKNLVWVLGNNTGSYSKYCTMSESAIRSFPLDYNSSTTEYIVRYGNLQNMWDVSGNFQFACTKTIGKHD